MREIKFRVYDTRFDKYLKNTKGIIINAGTGQVKGINGGPGYVDSWQLEQFTGLTDKNGVEIYEGDIVLFKEPSRDSQTHTGDNIPLGSYTEPLEPIIKESKYVVGFKEGMFYCYDPERDKEDNDFFDLSPLSLFCMSYDLESAKEGFSCGWDSYESLTGRFIWDEEEEGDLQYLLDEYDLSSEEELIKYLGLEVIGNIHKK